MIIRRSRAERQELALTTDPMEGKTVMGIDPGTNVLGYGVLQIVGGEPKCRVLGVVSLGKFRNPYQKLRHIFERVSALVAEYKPDEMALEAPFYGDKYQKITQIKSNLESTQDQMTQNLTMALARGEQLNVMEAKAENIKDSAATFRREATNVRRRMCLQKWKWYFIGIAIAVVVIFIIVWVACGASFQKCRKSKDSNSSNSTNESTALVMLVQQLANFLAKH